jgi:alpha-ketoglutarate-dependent 2,4-dichlorophenoxyacetate dioxygenase
MAVTFKPLQPLFAAEVSGVDIGAPLSAEDRNAIDAGMDRYAVLVFRREAPLSNEAQLAFSRALGPLEDAAYKRIEANAGPRISDPNISDISNLNASSKLLERDDRRRLFMLGNRLWHSDSSYKRIPAKYSLLSAHVVPPEGGETEFADMRAAWDALSGWKKDQLRNLVCEHSRLYSKGALGFDFSEEERAAFVPVQQRLVRRHPGSDRLALFLSSHIGAIVGMMRPEALMLLRDLTEHATQRQFVHAHNWRAGDLVMWDNRCTMHRGRDYDDVKYPRDLRRTTLTDIASTLEQAA